MSNKNKIEQAAKMLLNLELEDFIAVENVIDRMINSKNEKSKVQQGTKEQ